ncbi:hypothetical protein ACWOAH_09625 [Vagococcus vulneris]|uniref:hypothetical protein n=1 Tax=Vagococcus vulneris TaxID=1977869 RepID=UPI000F7F2887|nr:hypothetical protein [Vagococcus vulneris]
MKKNREEKLLKIKMGGIILAFMLFLLVFFSYRADAVEEKKNPATTDSAGFSDVTEHEGASIYDSFGQYVSGRKVPPETPVNVIKYRKQENHHIKKDITFNGNQIDDPHISIGNVMYFFASTKKQVENDKQTGPVGAIFKLKNVGVDSQGRKVVLCINSGAPLAVKVSVATGALHIFNLTEDVPTGADESYRIWFEYEDGKKITEKDSLFLLVGSLTGDNRIDEKPDEINEMSRMMFASLENNVSFNKDHYYLTYSDIKREYLSTIFFNGYTLDVQPVKDDRPFNLTMSQNETLKIGIRNYSSLGNPMDNFQGMLSLFGHGQITIMTIPTPPPFITSTKNDSGEMIAKLHAEQEIPLQDGENKYPDTVKLTIKLPKNILQSKVDVTKFTAAIGDYVVTNAIEFDHDKGSGVITATITGNYLKNFAAITPKQNLVIEGDLPLDTSQDDLLNSKTDNNYLEIKGTKIKNNQTAKENTNSMFVKIKGPTADTKTINVLRGTHTSELNPEDYVTNLKGFNEKDVVRVLGFREDKTFEVGDKSIDIHLISQNTGVESYVTCKVNVEDALVSPPEYEDEKPTMGYYAPKIKQKFDFSDTLDDLSVMMISPEYVDVSEDDFNLFGRTKDGTTNISLEKDLDYKVLIDSDSIAHVEFTRDAINKFKQGYVYIKQQSPLNKKNPRIVDSMIKKDSSKNMAVFKFKAQAYNKATLGKYKSESPKKSHDIYTNYIINLSGNPKKDKKVKKDAEVGKPEDYIDNLSKPDFLFDKILLSFEKGSNAPDFSSIGLKTFNIIISSVSFGFETKVPVTVEVVKDIVPDVDPIKVKVSQVYANNESQCIYSDLSNKTEVKTIEADAEPGINLQEILDTLLESEKDFKLNGYEGYESIPKTVVDSAYFKLVVNDKEVSSPIIPKDVVSDDKVELRILYTGQTKLKDVPSFLSYGEQQIPKNTKDVVFTLRDSNKNKLTILDTELVEDNKWDLSVNMPNGFNNEKGNPFKGNIVYVDQNNKRYPISKTNQVIEEKQGTDLKHSIPLNPGEGRGLVVQAEPNGEIGDYKGEINWSLVSGPKATK